MEHIYNSENFGENWFNYPNVYKHFVDSLEDNSIIAEVGCWKGKSTAYLAVEIINSKKNIKIHAIDTWEGSDEHRHLSDIQNNTLYETFLRNIKPVENVIIPIRKKSIDAAKDYQDNSIDIVFIDACHDYECVKEDIINWFPKVKNNGIIAGHDYMDNAWLGVKKAVDEFFGSNIEKMEQCWIHKK